MWIIAAILSAFFAELTSILAKCGIKKTNSDLATALRTVVVLFFSRVMVFVVGSQGTITQIETKSLVFLFCPVLQRVHPGSAISRRCIWAIPTRSFPLIS